jgi:hypothetical protein
MWQDQNNISTSYNVWHDMCNIAGVVFENTYHDVPDLDQNTLEDDCCNYLIRQIIDLSNSFRYTYLTKCVWYKTIEGKKYKIRVTPWAYSDFQGLQQIGYDNINLNQFRATFTVLKDQLCFDNGQFRTPQPGDQIIEADGCINNIQPVDGLPHWQYSIDNPCKNTIILYAYKHTIDM